MTFNNYKWRYRLGDYDKNILEELISGKKNIYQIHKRLKEKMKIPPYSSVLRSVKKLEKDKLIIMIGREKRNSKVYKITLVGIAIFYFSKKGKENSLIFLHSRNAKNIIDLFVKEFFKVKKEQKNKFFLLKSLYISPSLIESTLLHQYLEEPVIVREPSLLNEIVRCMYPSCGKIHHWELSEEDIKSYYYNQIFPLRYLALDYKKYPEDQDIKKLFIEGVVKANKATGERLAEMIDEHLKYVLDQIKSGETKRFKENTIYENETWENIPIENFFIFIPPGGVPVLSTDK